MLGTLLTVKMFHWSKELRDKPRDLLNEQSISKQTNIVLVTVKFQQNMVSIACFGPILDLQAALTT